MFLLDTIQGKCDLVMNLLQITCNTMCSRMSVWELGNIFMNLALFLSSKVKAVISSSNFGVSWVSYMSLILEL